MPIFCQHVANIRPNVRLDLAPSSCQILHASSYILICDVVTMQKEKQATMTCRNLCCTLLRLTFGRLISLINLSHKIHLEAQQRYFSYRAILVAIVSQKFFDIVYSANKGLPLPLGCRVCQTKSKNGRSKPRKPLISRVFCAQRGIETMV